MKPILKIAPLLFAIASFPAWADPDKNESGHHWNDRPSWTGTFEAEREARKHREEIRRERHKHFEELERESHKAAAVNSAGSPRPLRAEAH